MEHELDGQLRQREPGLLSNRAQALGHRHIPAKRIDIVAFEPAIANVVAVELNRGVVFAGRLPIASGPRAINACHERDSTE